MYKVSVIVPVYNVEKFITRCAESLFGQTLESVEYIFINDAATDNSMEMLNKVIKQYPHRRNTIKIVNHEKNKGLPAARNTGLLFATGDYVFHCDSDDFLDERMLETLYEKASLEGADIVWSDWYLSFERTERYMSQPCCESPHEALVAMLSGRMKYNVWNKLVRRELYTLNKISFLEGCSMGEDMTMIMLFACAKTIAYIPRALYHYVKLNSNAISYVYTSTQMQSIMKNIDRVSEFLEAKGQRDFSQEIAFLKLEAKWPLLLSNKMSSYRYWKELFPETNRYIGQNKNVSWRRRFVEKASKAGIFLVPWIHYWMVCRFYYGIIYK